MKFLIKTDDLFPPALIQCQLWQLLEGFDSFWRLFIVNRRIFLFRKLMSFQVRERGFDGPKVSA